MKNRSSQWKGGAIHQFREGRCGYIFDSLNGSIGSIGDSGLLQLKEKLYQDTCGPKGAGIFSLGVSQTGEMIIERVHFLERIRNALFIGFGLHVDRGAHDFNFSHDLNLILFFLLLLLLLRLLLLLLLLLFLILLLFLLCLLFLLGVPLFHMRTNNCKGLIG